MEVAVAVGIARSTLATLESGKDVPGRDTLVALAKFYDVSLEWLANGVGPQQAGAAAARTEEEALLLYAFRALPEAEAKPLLQYLVTRVKPPSN